MGPTAPRLLRPLVAFTALALAALVLAPTVASVGADLESLHIKRETLWHIWNWATPPPPQTTPPECERVTYHLESEVTEYPAKLQKSQPYDIGGTVIVKDTGAPMGGIKVDVFLNETKTQPGEYVGKGVTDDAGRWRISGTLPFEMQATHYHIVAHALPTHVGCKDYHDHWSDPEMNVTAHSKIVLDGPWHAVGGKTVNLTGTLLDDVGAPIRNQPVTLAFGGKTYPLTTDAAGGFRLSLVPPKLGSMTVRATYAGNAYYSPAQAESALTVLDDTITLNGLYAGSPLALVRSQPLELNGQIYLRANASYANVTLQFGALKVRACPTCPVVDKLTATPDATGAFVVTVVADASQRPGAFPVTVTGGGVRNATTFQGSLVIPTSLELSVADHGPVSKAFNGTLVVADDVGPLANASVALLTPAGWIAGTTDANGVFPYAAEGPACGPGTVEAHYNATGERMPAVVSKRVDVCGAVVAESTALLAIPWWAWALLVVVPLVAWWAYRRLRERFATTLSHGPPLTLAFHEPNDAAAGLVALGEAATLSALLEAPLPEGHRLRLGTARRMEDAQPEGLEARLALVPDRWGDVPVRAEIVDARGRVVTRRTRTLRVVRYAEEIERRYRALQQEHERSGRVSPREFEAWLRRRHPGLDPAVTRRLVGVFEEADYGPRRAGRPELLAFLEAERAVEEVPVLASE